MIVSSTSASNGSRSPSLQLSAIECMSGSTWSILDDFGGWEEGLRTSLLVFMLFGLAQRNQTRNSSAKLSATPSLAEWKSVVPTPNLEPDLGGEFVPWGRSGTDIGDETINPRDQTGFVWIPASSFVMGPNDRAGF